MAKENVSTVQQKAVLILKKSGVKTVFNSKTQRLTLMASERWTTLVKMSVTALCIYENFSRSMITDIISSYNDIFDTSLIITPIKEMGVYDVLNLLVRKSLLQRPKKIYDGDDYFHFDYCSKQGWKAYGLLIDMLYLLDEISPCFRRVCNVNSVIDYLDSLINRTNN